MECSCPVDAEPCQTIRLYEGPAKRNRRTPCVCCGGTISAGDEIREEVFAFEGTVDRELAHRECHELMRAGVALICDESGWIYGTRLDDLSREVLAVEAAGYVDPAKAKAWMLRYGEIIARLDARGEG